MSDLLMTHTNRHVASGAEWGQVAATLLLAWRTISTRRALPTLAPEQLADIGISRATALAEAARLPWDIRRPSWRRRATSRLQRAWEAARQRQLTAEPRASGLYDL